MELRTRRAGALIAAAFFITVVTQIAYVAMLEGVGIVEGWPLRSTLWTIELFAFAAIAVASLVLMVRDAPRAFIWGALAVSGLLNIVQAGIGLSTFLPMTEAGEQFAPVMGAIVAGAFLFYFLAKALVGLAGIGLGLALFARTGTPLKAVGALSVVAGLIAAAMNMVAIPQGMSWVFEAGATGTIAALTTGIAIWLVTQRAD
jgi:hypothetical protein